MSGKRPRRPETLNKDGLWELIQRCWDQDPGKRPTTPELLEFFRASYVPPFLCQVADTYSVSLQGSQGNEKYQRHKHFEARHHLGL